VFVANATTGVRTVLASLRPDATSEIVTTDHAYPAVRTQLAVGSREDGYTTRVVPLPFPMPNADAIVAAVVDALSPRTTLLVIDHVAAPSGLVLPIERIAAAARQRGIPVLVDGAHAAGMLPVDVSALGVDFWVGNLHKWICAPKAAAVLWIAPQWREQIRPLVPAVQYDEGLQPAFDWTGTTDPTPILAAPSALDFFDSLGWDTVRSHNRSLATEGARAVAAALGTELPVSDELSGALRIVDLGRSFDPAAARSLEQRLYDEHRIEVPVTYVNGNRWLRLSAQVYNDISDYERLASVLRSLLRE
jgi:isopenicillin-N epimerase